MKIFLDTACLETLKKWQHNPLIDGVTTNPTLVAKNTQSSCQRTLEGFARSIFKMNLGPVSLEVTGTEQKEMMDQGRLFHQWAKEEGGHGVVKVPLTPAGLQACHGLIQEGIEVNVTVCFSLPQALLAAKAGATYISPFLGRLDDAVLNDGLTLMHNIRKTYDTYGFHTKILAASVRNMHHVQQLILLGVDVITIPPGLLEQMHHHPLTDRALEIFAKDWETAGIQ